MWCVFFFKQKTAYEMRISDWSSDVCSSDLVQRLCGDHEAARVLGQMSGKTDQLSGQAQDPTQHWAVRVETTFAQAIHWRRLVTPAPATVGQRVDLIRRQAQGFGDVPHRAGTVVAADHRRQCRTMATVTLEHVLQHFFTTLVFKVDVDFWRLFSFPGQESLEQICTAACR